jgi:hypothetical protein
MAMRVEIGPISSECLKRKDAAGPYISSAEQALKGFQYGGIGGLRQQYMPEYADIG